MSIYETARCGTDSVSLLKGCGKVTTAKLNTHGVYTYRDLLGFTGVISGVNIDHLRHLASREIGVARTSVTMDYHSWKGMVGHLIRSKGHVTRVIIGDLVVGPHTVHLNTSWIQGGKIHRKAVSPVSLLCAQIMWLSNDIVSDESDSDSYDPVETTLPKFLVETENPKIKTLTKPELDAIHSIVRETNQLFNCVYLTPIRPLGLRV